MPLALNAEIVGENNRDPIVILHGLFGSGKNWRTIAKQLAGSYCVFSIDLRNHGSSPWHDQMDYEQMAEDVAQYIEQKGIFKPTLIGHSMGGKTAMTLLQHSKTEFRQVFIVDIAPVAYAHNHNGLIDAMLSVDLFPGITRKEIETRLAVSLDQTAVRQFLMQNIIRVNENQFKWNINLKSIKNNMHYLLDYKMYTTITTPVVFVAGSLSEYILPEHYSTIYSLFPNAVIETIEGAGHWLHAERPTQFLQIINRYI